MVLNKLDLNNIDKKIGFDYSDQIRVGRSDDIDLMKLAAVIVSFNKTINELVDRIIEQRLMIDTLDKRLQRVSKKANKRK